MPAAAIYFEPGPATACDLTPANDGAATACHADGAFVTGAFGTEAAMDFDDLSLAPSPWSSPARLDAGETIVPRLHAVRRDGELYDGDLWTDILEYRHLRMRDLRGELLDADARERLLGHEHRLRDISEPRNRQFLRFQCKQRTWVLLADGAMLGATLHDLSAGGARVEIEGTVRLPEGAALALCVDTFAPNCSTVLPSRVVWTKPGVCGLMFAGPPRVQS